MDHNVFKEMIQLALLDELNDDELKKLHLHLIECSECQAEHDRLKNYYYLIDQNKNPEPDELFLADARRQFRMKLNYDLSKQSVIKKILNSFRKNLWLYKRPVLAGAFSLLIGFFAGYLFFSPESSKIVSLADNTLSAGGNASISNVQFINSVSNNGEVEFTYDLMKKVKMRGQLNDPAIQKILAEALVNEKNPGTRIQTVNALSNQASQKNNMNPKVKSALISALKNDNNPGVRMESLKTLLNLPFDNEINESLLYVLQHDKNSGLRIAAINGLASATLNGKTMDEQTLKVLNQKVKNDDNEYVRIRAASLLKEDKIQ
jgi:hypothetical protein